MRGGVRRVITGHSRDGKAMIVSDGRVPVVRHAPLRPGHEMNEVWVTSARCRRSALRASAFG